MRSSHAGVIVWVVGFAAAGQTSSPNLPAVLSAIDRDTPAAEQFLEKIININSGTFNPAGVKALAAVMDAEFRSLGFETKLISNDTRQRGPHLLAEHKGSHPGKPLLLIGHMDTVFEPASPFQRFERISPALARGPGVSDMKGGLTIMLFALKALQSAGLLANANIRVFLTGDEEAPGKPVADARRDLIEAARGTTAAFCFEGGNHADGHDYISTARRGAVIWELRVKGTPGHSGGVFSTASGYGAIYEISRILDQFDQQLREPNLTYSVGLLLGGANVHVTPDGAGTVEGKPNIIPGEALARGDLRALTPEQVNRVKDKMYGIVSKSLPGTSSELKFSEDEAYPPMAPTAGNRQLLATVNAACTRAGIPEALELDPMRRGAGDSSFIAPYTNCLTGFGAIGTGAHAPGESIDLSTLPRTIKRAAVAIHELTK